jgi:glutamine amidotransferase
MDGKMSVIPCVTVIDYGMGNLLSVTRAFEFCGAQVEVTQDPGKIEDATRLVLPGVGAFPDGMKELHKRGLVEVIQRYVAGGRFFLGICLGLQMMMDQSEEHEVTQGLGIIPGKVAAIPLTDHQGRPHKVPHIGWNRLLEPPQSGGWNSTILEGLQPGVASAYFVHSFTALPVDSRHRLADADYNGRFIAAALRKGNAFGCQFHPEKSGFTGLQIIRNFLHLNPNP